MRARALFPSGAAGGRPIDGRRSDENGRRSFAIFASAGTDGFGFLEPLPRRQPIKEGFAGGISLLLFLAVIMDRQVGSLA